MPDETLPSPVSDSELPTLHEHLSNLFGFKLPVPRLPQTAKNLDKALGRVILAFGENWTARIERNTGAQKARGIAEKRIIQREGARLIEESTANPAIAERARTFSFGDSVLKQENREKIARITIEHLANEDVSVEADAPESIDDDWLNGFAEAASSKSNEEIQVLWAKMLARKIRNPASFSIKSLQLMSALDARDANLIHEVLSLAVSCNFILSDGVDDLTRYITCEELGILYVGGGIISPNFQTEPGQPFVLLTHDEAFVSWPSEQKNFSIPAFMLTRFGKEILSLSKDYIVDETYKGRLKEVLDREGLNVSRQKIVDVSA